jgi:hypothetical protein
VLKFRAGDHPLKTINLRITHAPKPTLRSKPVPEVSHFYQRPGKPSAAPAGQNVVNEDRRRVQRVLLRVRAQIHVALQGKMQSFQVTTHSVNDHGALVLLDRSLPVDTLLVLEHAQTKERVACKVVQAGRETPEGFQVPVEFDSPAPGFWKIAFPPSDWKP